MLGQRPHGAPHEPIRNRPRRVTVSRLTVVGCRRDMMSHVLILRLVALSFLVTGCLRADLVECGDRSCPQGTLCDMVHATCVDPQQLVACDGITTGDRCSYAGLVGTCIDGTCFEPRCGDHVITGVEVCDDGNRVSGDGCAADCESAEVCGDGVYEAARGEECDDGNSRSGDACSSTCRAETLTSIKRQCGHPQNIGRIVFDRARGQLVRLDGASGAPPRTFTWDGTWSCGPNLPLNNVASAAYDVARERVVVFGTRDGQKLVEEWDGVTWSERSTTRTHTNLAYDPANARFLGYDISDVDHVSVWDGASNTWTSLTAAGSGPSASSVIHSTFDESRNDFIVQLLVTFNEPMQTWAFQTSTLLWRRLGDVPSSFAAAMTYDASRSQVVSCTNSTLYGLDAAGTWTAVPNLTGTVSCYLLAYDTVTPRIVALDGLLNLRSVWTLDGNAWTKHEPVGLAPLNAASIVAVPSLGGVLGLNQNGETAVWNGLTWTVGPPSPPWVASPRLAYDPSREVVVGFDGTKMAELASGVWQSVTTDTVPSLRSMIFDPSRGTLIAMSTTGALYVRSGTAWQPFDVPLPSGGGGGIAFDTGRERLVAVVLANGTHVYELDGSTWTEIFALTSSNYLLVQLSARGSLVFVADTLNGSWERKGDVWRRFDSMLPGTQTFLLADDPLHGEAVVVMSGGRDVFGVGDHSATPPESCSDGEDVDGDGHTGCDDDDCWWRCP